MLGDIYLGHATWTCTVDVHLGTLGCYVPYHVPPWNMHAAGWSSDTVLDSKVVFEGADCKFQPCAPASGQTPQTTRAVDCVRWSNSGRQHRGFEQQPQAPVHTSQLRGRGERATLLTEFWVVLQDKVRAGGREHD